MIPAKPLDRAISNVNYRFGKYYARMGLTPIKVRVCRDFSSPWPLRLRFSLKWQFKNVVVKTYIPVMYTSFNKAIDDCNDVEKWKWPIFSLVLLSFLKSILISWPYSLKICVQNVMMISKIVYAWKSNKYQTHFHIYIYLPTYINLWTVYKVYIFSQN